MITVVIPTRNRAYTLAKVANSYFSQEAVSEVIVIDDCGSDNTPEVVECFERKYPDINTVYVRNERRMGAAAGRVKGSNLANNDYVLFGEDDAYLDKDYVNVLLRKLIQKKNCGIVSGRIIYLKSGEQCDNGLARFGNGIKGIEYFNSIGFSFNIDAYIDEDLSVPFTHAIFLTHRSLLKRYPYDTYYAKGNGFREETDYQLNLLCAGYEIVVTPNTHCFHMSIKDVPLGGQRINRFKKLYWNTKYTNYMYDKFFNKLKKNLGIKYGLTNAKLVYFLYQIYILFIKPPLNVLFKRR